MFKVIVNNEIVDLADDNVQYVSVDEDDGYVLCEKDSANAVMCCYEGIYQIKGKKKNVESSKYPMAIFLPIERDEFDEISEALAKNVIVSIPNDEHMQCDENPQQINLLNKIKELESKLNKILNAE